MCNRLRIGLLIGILLAGGLMLPPTVRAQTFSAQIQQFWNQLSTGVLVFTNLRATTGTIGTLNLTTLNITNLTLTNLTTTGVIRMADGTAAAPSVAFALHSGDGWFSPNGGAMDLALSGVGSIRFSSDVQLKSTGQVTWSSGAYNATADTFISRLAAGSIGMTHSGLAATPGNGLSLINATASTAGVPVQMPPSFRWLGHVWNTTAGGSDNTDEWFADVLPASAATPTSTFRLRWSQNGGAAVSPMTVTGDGNLVTLGNVSVAAGTSFYTVGRTSTFAPSDGTYNIRNNSNSAGIGFDVTTDSTLKVRTRAQTGYGTVDALGYSVSGTPGATHAACSVAITAITVTNGIITAITCT